MTDFAQARRMMVEGQIRPNDVTDLRVLAAFDDMARERYVPERWQAIAYLDRDVPVEKAGRCVLKPVVLAKLIQAAEIGEGDRVLDVGCTTGYASAVLAKLVFTPHGEDPRRHVDVSENSLYWRFVWLSWLPIYLLIYWLPRWFA